MGVLFDWVVKSSGKSEVSQFYVEFVSSVDENILWFEVSVDDSIRVTELKREEELEDDFLDLGLGEGVVLQVLFEVTVAVFEDEM